MQRTTKKVIPKWKKTTGKSSFRLYSGKIVKPGEIFHAEESDIPKAFMFQLERMNDVEAPKEKEVIKPEKSDKSIQTIPEEHKPIEEPEIELDELTDVEKQELGEEVIPKPAKDSQYTPKEKGGGWWDIVDSKGNVVNDRAIRTKDVDSELAKLMTE